jgi:predicted GTPase
VGINTARSKPLVVVVMGQTGVGKSSLINALFGINLKTNDARPETKFPEKHIERSSDGHELWFWDMPGIGESTSADAGYLVNYQQKIMEADVALWLCHADSRSVTFDVEAVQKILANLPDAEQSILLSKLTFVLSKADLVAPEPWILYKTDQEAIFETAEKTEKLLDEKAAYFREALIEPHKEKFVSRTFHDGNFNLQKGLLTSDKYFAYYSGLMSLSILKNLKSEYPEYAQVFERLYQNSEVVYCSSRFRYNLAKLMSVIVNKIGGDTSIRFANFISTKAMNRVSWSKARTFSNLVSYDVHKDHIIFDLAALK